jgi:bacterioferritin-associated ferredoxin
MSESNDVLINEVLCTCTGTTYGQITDLVGQGYDLDGICSKKGVLSGCGGCEWDLEVLMQELQK